MDQRYWLEYKNKAWLTLFKRFYWSSLHKLMALFLIRVVIFYQLGKMKIVVCIWILIKSHSSKEIDPIKKEKTSQDQAFLANAPAATDTSIVPELTKSSPVYSLDVQVSKTILYSFKNIGWRSLVSGRYWKWKYQFMVR